MSIERTVDSLARLVELRQVEVDRLGGELAGMQALRRRYQDNLERMEGLLATAVDPAHPCPVLYSNSAHYKTLLVDMIVDHRRELAGHEACMEQGRQALLRATLKHRRLDDALKDKRHALQGQRHAREQKRQDQLAAQAWCRTHFHSNGTIGSR